ncbi:uncharacterized protein MELLADRAFT_63379 [Melampsora larici-populina 98AG31]|uniref:Secreted protein n=1 Tax=Melampsora larici-populina (strain 98AG31 / pathotype 3-4-7) TaxID=747676 RepID=F4RMG0_MELLP|nr:uncharacterized protein MELLADRAFT_63379 [Melampsora larici-populina 98AG31]EGG06422.1 hypothetical protein MELLADRAFT_63379 [Melampsora larici-populina 98AG31]
MDLFNKKLCQNIVLMLKWPILLTAMGVQDLSKIIGHPVPTMGNSYFAEPFDPALHQQEVSSLAREYTSSILFDVPEPSIASDVGIPTWSTGHDTAIDDFYTSIYGKSSLPSLHYSGEMSSGVFNARDGAVNSWSGAESQEGHPTHQEVGEDTQSHLSRPASQVATPRRDANLLNVPSSDTHANILGEDSWDQDQLAGKRYYPEGLHAIHQPPGIADDSLARLDLLRESSPKSPEVRAPKPHHEWKSVKSPSVAEPPPGTLEMFGKVSPSEAYPQSLQGHSFDKLPNLARIPASRGYDHSALLSSSMYLFSTEHRIAFYPESYPGHSLGGDQNFESFMDSRIFHSEPQFTTHDASIAPPAFPVISPVSNQRNPLETLGDSFNHFTDGLLRLTKPISTSLEENQGTLSEWSSRFGLQDTPSISSPPLHSSSLYSPTPAHEVFLNQGPVSYWGLAQRNRGWYIVNQPGSNEIHHADVLPILEGASMGSHKYSGKLLVPLSKQGGGSSEESSRGFFNSEGQRSFEAVSGNERSDDSRGSGFVHWKNNGVKLGRAEPGIILFLLRLLTVTQVSIHISASSYVKKKLRHVVPSSDLDKQNLYQEKPSMTFENTRSTFRDARVRFPRPDQRKRPTQTYQVDPQSSKRQAQLDPSLSDETVGSITQAKKRSPSIEIESRSSESSALSTQRRSRSKPRDTRVFDSGTKSAPKVRQPRKKKNRSKKSLDLDEDH